MAISGLEIFDEGQSFGFWKRTGFDNPGYSADSLIRVKSVADMVTKVLAVTNGQKGRIRIFFNGIGSVNYQSVGAGAMQDSSGDRSLQVDGTGELNQAGKVWLPRLVGRVSGIYLLGVDNKANLISVHTNASNPLLIAVANIFTGVFVNDRVGDGNHIINFGKSEKPAVRLRTEVERQKLRESLSKLDKK